MKIRAHKHISTALGIFALRKFDTRRLAGTLDTVVLY